MADDTGAQPAFEIVSGDLSEDGWTTRKVALRILKRSKPRVLRIGVRNPGFNQAYLRNPVTIRLDDEVVFSDLMFAGQNIMIEQPLPAREELLLEVESQAVLFPDYFDIRERGVILRLST